MFEYIFDYKYYISEYPDLHSKNLSEKDAWKHFFEYGIHENRKCKDWKKIINLDFYINNYPDLLNANIKTPEQILVHWFRYGIYEMRHGYNILYPSYEEFIDNKHSHFTYDPTNSNTNLIDYIKRYSLLQNDYRSEHVINNLYTTIKKDNCISIDMKFYKYANNLPYNDLYELLDHFHTDGLYGLIYSPKQLRNIFKTIQIYEFYGELYCETEKSPIIKLNEFIKKNIYEKSFNEFKKLLIKLYEDTILPSINLCILLFIGNEERGNQIIDMLIEYKNMEIFNIAICFNSYSLYNTLKNKILANFENYRLYISNDIGNDIVPTLLMYDDLSETYNPLHIIKLQTKSSYGMMYDLTRYLLDKPLSSLLLYTNRESNTIGNPHYYMRLSDDGFNRDLYNKYSNKIDINRKFVIATIFYISGDKMGQIKNFVKENNYKAYLLNNMYDSNRIVTTRSHVHFLERLFGVI
jgi:hypothetical protein